MLVQNYDLSPFAQGDMLKFLFTKDLALFQLSSFFNVFFFWLLFYVGSFVSL